MKVLIRSAKIIDKYSSHHGEVLDILIVDGKIVSIGQVVSADVDHTIEGEDLHVSTGWFDMRVHAKEPGYEHRESLESLENAALNGGFSEILTLPNTNPIIQTKEGVHFLKNAGKILKIHPSAAVTIKTEGKDFTEMLDLNAAGAKAFTDGEHTIQNADIFLKSLQYLGQFGGLLIQRPEDYDLTHFGQIHDGITSAMLGMKGMPPMAEELMIVRDLKLLEYVAETPFITNTEQNSRLHFSCISSANSVKLIREAKEKGLAVTCDVAVHQLCFIDEDLMSFDTNLKVNPPFRSREDVLALWKGLEDGTIDAIVSDHTPHDEESKKLEFDMAEFGVIGLETLFGAVNQANKILDLATIIEKITSNPREILGLSQPQIEEGLPANLTIFDPEISWIYDEKNIVSQSKNSPFIGKKLVGKSIAVINGKKFFKTTS
jgi:dihydroorotase